MLPNARLLARAFHRIPTPPSTPSTSVFSTSRTLSTSTPNRTWEGRQPSAHVTNEKDSHNVQVDAVKEGKEDKAKGDGNGSRGATEQSGGANQKAKEEFPEAPDTIGMQDERGGNN